MNYDKPELIERLASEYVLGTLSGAARRRFQQLLQAYIPARRAVVRWEGRLLELAMRLPPVVPSMQVWDRIKSRIGEPVQRPSAPARHGLWKALAAGLAAVSIGLLTLLITREPELRVERLTPQHTSIITDQKAALWSVDVFPGTGQLRVRAVQPIAVAADRSLELWMLPDAGTPPVSLGLLPTSGEITLPLNAAAAAVLVETSTFAVSLEPSGGSPTGAPTGPVLYTAPVVHASG